MSAAERLEAELKAKEPSRAKKATQGQDSGESVFRLANGVDTIALLDRLGIEHDREKFATCPGCGEPGAKFGDNGGLKCMHNRCSDAGPPNYSGFRTPVDIVATVEGIEPTEAALKICSMFGIEVPGPKKTTAESASVSVPTPDDEPPSSERQRRAIPPEPSVLDERWIDLANALEFIEKEPPAQTWLLKQWHDQQDHGVFPRGKTGLLTATGGVGKTYAIVQLAVAVASGGFWLESFRAVNAGHVLIALGEEDADEARRRIWRALNATELSMEERRAVASRMHLLIGRIFT
jgi:hypothetical protein